MKKVHLKKKRKIYKILIIFFILYLVISYFGYVNKKIIPILRKYAEVSSRTIAVSIINDSINKSVKKKLNEDMFIITKDEKGEIKTLDINPKTSNEILSIITKNITDSLQHFDNGKLKLKNVKLDKDNNITFYIPMGVLTNSIFLSYLGPKIPVKITYLGNMSSYLYTKVTEYGINNALVEVFIHVSVTEKVILPITTKDIEVVADMPIAIKLIQGNIPYYYLQNDSSNLTVPNVK